MPDIKTPMFGVGRMYQNHREEFLDAADKVLSTGKLLDGEYTLQFEQAIAARCQRKHAIAVNSGSTAILFSLLYYSSIVEYKTVLIPDISFIATVNSPLLTGFKIIPSDVDRHGLLNLSKVDTDIHKIGLIMYVNLCGNMIDYNKLRLITSFFNDNQPIIEDAAQSFGAMFDGIPSGKAGDASILSFDPTKNLPNFGSGGMVLTDDSELYSHVMTLRDNGRHTAFSMPGTNSKMSETDCAQMLIKLKYFDEWQERRATIANYYSYRLHNYVDVPAPLPGVKHAWSKYIITTPDRELLFNKLLDVGVLAKINYPRPLHVQDVTGGGFADTVGFRDGGSELSSAFEYSKNNLALPIYPELTDNEIDLICDTIESVYI